MVAEVEAKKLRNILDELKPETLFHAIASRRAEVEFGTLINTMVKGKGEALT